MAIPTFFGAGALAAVESGSATPAFPASWQADDVAVIAVMTNAGNTFNTPSGWTQFGTAMNSGNQSSTWFWRRLVAGDTAPAISIASGTALGVANGLFARCYVFRGCIRYATPVESIANAGTPTSNTTPTTAATFNTVRPDVLAVCIAVVDDDNTWSSGMPPASWANIGGRLASTLGADCMIDAISRDVATSGTSIAQVNVGTQSATDYWRTLTFTLRGPLALVETLTDNFDDNSMDAAKWTTITAAGFSIAETNQRLELGGDGRGVMLGGYTSNGATPTAFGLLGSSMVVEIVGAGLTGTASRVRLEGWLDANNSVGIYKAHSLAAGHVVAYRLEAGSAAVNVDGGAYAATHLRLREAAGTLYYEASDDGGVTWDVITSEATPAIAATLWPRLLLELTGAVLGTGQFENFNLPPVVYNDSPTGTAALAGTITEGLAFGDAPAGTVPPTGSIVESYAQPRRARVYWAELIVPPSAALTIAAPAAAGTLAAGAASAAESAPSPAASSSSSATAPSLRGTLAGAAAAATLAVTSPTIASRASPPAGVLVPGSASSVYLSVPAVSGPVFAGVTVATIASRASPPAAGLVASSSAAVALRPAAVAGVLTAAAGVPVPALLAIAPGGLLSLAATEPLIELGGAPLIMDAPAAAAVLAAVGPGLLGRLAAAAGTLDASSGSPTILELLNGVAGGIAATGPPATLLSRAASPAGTLTSSSAPPSLAWRLSPPASAGTLAGPTATLRLLAAMAAAQAALGATAPSVTAVLVASAGGIALDGPAARLAGLVAAPAGLAELDASPPIMGGTLYVSAPAAAVLLTGVAPLTSVRLTVVAGGMTLASSSSRLAYSAAAPAAAITAAAGPPFAASRVASVSAAITLDASPATVQAVLRALAAALALEGGIAAAAGRLRIDAPAAAAWLEEADARLVYAIAPPAGGLELAAAAPTLIGTLHVSAGAEGTLSAGVPFVYTLAARYPGRLELADTAIAELELLDERHDDELELLDELLATLETADRPAGGLELDEHGLAALELVEGR